MASEGSVPEEGFADDPELTWWDERNGASDLGELVDTDPLALTRALDRVRDAKDPKELGESLWQIQRHHGGLRGLGFLLRLRRQQPHSEARFLERAVKEAERRVLYKEMADRIAQDPELLLALHSGFPDSFPSPGSDPLRPLKTRLRALAQQLSPIHSGLVRLGYEKFAEPLKQLITDCESFAFRVFVVGEFSTGKSTLINALLGHEYLPTGFEPVTLAPTRIGYGREPRLFVKAFGKTEQPVERFELLKELKLDANEVGLGASDLEYLRVEVPVPLLHNGLCLIDTPGLNEVSQRGRLIADLLQEADAVILVTAANRLMTGNEQDLLRVAQQLPADQKHWLDAGVVAVTFADVVCKGAKTPEAVEQRLAPLRQRLDRILLELHPPSGFARSRRFFMDATEIQPTSMPEASAAGRGVSAQLLRSLKQFLAVSYGGGRVAQSRDRALNLLRGAKEQLDAALKRHQQEQQMGIDEQQQLSERIAKLRCDGLALSEKVDGQVHEVIQQAKAGLEDRLRELLSGLDSHLVTQENPHSTLTDLWAAAGFFAKQGQAYVQGGLDAWVQRELIPQIGTSLAPIYQQSRQLAEEAQAIAQVEDLGLGTGLKIEVVDSSVLARVAWLVGVAGTGAVAGGALGLGTALLLSLSTAVIIPLTAVLGTLLLMTAALGVEVSSGRELLRRVVSKQIKEKVEAQLPAVSNNLALRLREQIGNLPLAIRADTERMAALLEEQLQLRQQEWQRSQGGSAAHIVEINALQAQLDATMKTLAI